MTTDRLDELLTKHGIKQPPCASHLSDGWFELIDTLFVNLIAIGWDKDLQQCKEKFGSLRLYTGEATSEMIELITTAENQSYHLCEVCGKAGEVRKDNYWWKTRCEEHKDS